MYCYLRKLVHVDAYLPFYLFVACIIFSCGLAMLAGGHVGRIVGYGAAGIVIFGPLIGLICHHVERTKKTNPIPKPPMTLRRTLRR